MARRHGHRGSGIAVPDEPIAAIVDHEWIATAREVIAQVEMTTEIVAYTVDFVRATREHPALSFGASPRSINVLCLAARARAVLEGRDYVVPDDVKDLVGAVIAHRVVLAPGAQLDGTTAGQVVDEIAEHLAVPR